MRTHRAEVSKVTEVGAAQRCLLKPERGAPLPEGRLLAPVRRHPDGTRIPNAMGLPESQFKGEIEEYLGPGKYRIHMQRVAEGAPTWLFKIAHLSCIYGRAGS